MAHYAYIDKNNIVQHVIVGKDETELCDGVAPEIYYAQNTDYVVKRTSYSGKIRYNFAGVGYTYDPKNDAFIAPQPFPSWQLNANFMWEAPIAYPSDGNLYSWNEEAKSWQLATSL